jgi:MerR HTH family regulatory protein
VVAIEAPDRLRMKDLVEATGVARSTIHYYVSEDLIPAPERPKPNVALYDPICVDLIRYIRDAQRLHRYPLDWIRTNVKHILAGLPPDEILHLNERLLGPPRPVFGPAQAKEQLGDSAAALERYVSLGLVYPTKEGNFDEFDIRVAELLLRAEETGLPAEAFSGVVNALKEVEAQTAAIVEEHIDNPMPMSAERAMLLVEVMGRLQPYLLRRFLEQRESP